MRKLSLFLFVIAAFTSGAVTPAFAQPGTAHPNGTSLNPTWEATLGYQTLHAPDQTFPFGLNIDGARNFGALALAAEAGWSYDKSDDISFNVLNLGAGPRWSGRSSSSIWPYVQVLAGLVHARASEDVTGFDVSDSITKFMVQPGAGAVFLAGDGWGISAQVDYRRVFLDEVEDGDSGENDFRVFVGVRFVLD
jgi:hypothetical protein